ncbi:MAG: patatin-like phospholipase family protein [Sorangiineae bacterium]|nr:patatin-like phospholipase family protein [Polyangiaceae bacterium]MEB2323659.1 patatin-like phospholipase family protein [Sorangiineae bacterium]
MVSELHTRPALVLSGGGTRGAYEVGVVAGIVEALRRTASDPPLFRIFAGTSVGAINVAYLAANAHHGDLGIDRLIEIWTDLRLEDHARLNSSSLLRWSSRIHRLVEGIVEPDAHGKSILDTRNLERIVTDAVDWSALHRNIDEGVVRSVLIAALHVETGRTTMFVQQAPGEDFRPTRDRRRRARLARIDAGHVLASAAIPLLFPSRWIDDGYYCDGGLRFNTPMAPAIRAGADKLVVVSPMFHEERGSLPPPPEAGPDDDLSVTFLAGKLLNALLLDPVSYDLSVLRRLNILFEVLEDVLPPEDLERVQKVLERDRGVAYRRIEPLVFSPSRNLGKVAGIYIRDRLRATNLNVLVRKLIERATRKAPGQEADWASYLLFDGGFARELIDLGRSDALARADAIREYFS